MTGNRLGRRACTRVVINDYAGHPFQLELSEALQHLGHDVIHAYCLNNITPHANFQDSSVHVIPLDTGKRFEKYNPLGRLRDELRYGIRSTRLLLSSRPQSQLLSNVPVLSLAVLIAAGRLLGCRSVVWLQDFQSPLARASLGNRWPVRILAALERWGLRTADHIVAVSEPLRLLAAGAGVPFERITVRSNWAPIGELPVRPKENTWASSHQLSERIVVLYSGTLGLKHDLAPLLAASDALTRCAPDARLVVMSEGIGADRLQAVIDSSDRRNILLLPFQPWKDLPNALGAADLLLVTLAEEMAEVSIPSKALTYLCAARPIVAAVPRNHPTAQLLEHDAGGGIVVDGGVAEFESLFRRLLGDDTFRAELGARNRQYAEATFDSRRAAIDFETILYADRLHF
jgi:colanic acid biosynthesis glycosyl transferase WcaI